jgi:hypothetical protein
MCDYHRKPRRRWGRGEAFNGAVRRGGLTPGHRTERVDAKIHAEEKTAAIVMAIDLRNVIRASSAAHPSPRPYCGVPFIGGEAWGLGGSLLLSRVASASCFFRKASYSGVPGLGGISFGAPPNHSGA